MIGGAGAARAFISTRRDSFGGKGEWPRAWPEHVVRAQGEAHGQREAGSASGGGGFPAINQHRRARGAGFGTKNALCDRRPRRAGTVRRPERSEPVSARPTRPAPRGPSAQGRPSGGVAAGTRRAAGKTAPGKRPALKAGLAPFSIRAAVRCPPAVFPLWCGPLEKGESGKGVSKGGKLKGENACPPPPAALFNIPRDALPEGKRHGGLGALRARRTHRRRRATPSLSRSGAAPGRARPTRVSVRERAVRATNGSE